MSLVTSIISYWKVNESSGNAADSAGSNTLTNNNTTPYVPAKISNGIDLESTSSQSMSIADNASLSITGDLTMALWIKPESLPATDDFYVLGGKFVFSTANRSYTLLIRDTASTVGLEFINSSNGTAESVLNVPFAFSAGTFYYVAITQSAGTATLYVNGSSIGTGSVNNGQFDSTAPFELGSINAGGKYFDGIEDEIGIWSRALSGAEITELYNGGVGLTYPFTTSNSGFFSIM